MVVVTFAAGGVIELRILFEFTHDFAGIALEEQAILCTVNNIVFAFDEFVERTVWVIVGEGARIRHYIFARSNGSRG